jgi:hypothetical protein
VICSRATRAGALVIIFVVALGSNRPSATPSGRTCNIDCDEFDLENVCLGECDDPFATCLSQAQLVEPGFEECCYVADAFCWEPSCGDESAKHDCDFEEL